MSATDNVLRTDKVRPTRPVLHSTPRTAHRSSLRSTSLPSLPRVERSWHIGPLTVTKDYAIALIIAVGAHVGVAVSGYFKSPPAPAAIVEEPTPVSVNVALEPEVDPELVDDSPLEPSTSAVDSFEPPRLVDVPSTTFDTSFVQPLQVSPPSVSSASLLTIPKGPARGEAVAGNINKIFDLKSLDQIPEVQSRMPPIYPNDLRRSGISGEVMVTFVVDQKGAVRDVEVISSTHPGFNMAAVNSVSKWRFKPGRKGGAAVLTRMELPITFKLNN